VDRVERGDDIVTPDARRPGLIDPGRSTTPLGIQTDTPEGTASVSQSRVNRDRRDVAAAWCPNLTGSGRLRPERWRVGGRRLVLQSVVAMIARDVVQIAEELTEPGEDPLQSAVRCAALWRELTDDAICIGLTRLSTTVRMPPPCAR